jgi:hypothetical protein
MISKCCFIIWPVVRRDTFNPEFRIKIWMKPSKTIYVQKHFDILHLMEQTWVKSSLIWGRYKPFCVPIWSVQYRHVFGTRACISRKFPRTNINTRWQPWSLSRFDFSAGHISYKTEPILMKQTWNKKENSKLLDNVNVKKNSKKKYQNEYDKKLHGATSLLFKNGTCWKAAICQKFSVRPPLIGQLVSRDKKTRNRL